VVEFGVSGKLIMNALVMYDRATESLWSQFLSRSVDGEFAGTELEIVPLTLTTWEAWKSAYPETIAMRKTRRTTDPYVGYYAGRSVGVIGETNVDIRLPTKELVLGIGFDDAPLAFPHSVLRSEELLNLQHAGSPTLVYFDPATDTAIAYKAEVSDVSLEFELVEANGRIMMSDTQTGSLWVPFTGQAISGELAGASLDRIHSVNAFWFSWSDFYPNTEIWSS